MTIKKYLPDSQDEIEQEAQAKEAREEAEAQGIDADYEQAIADGQIVFDK